MHSTQSKCCCLLLLVVKAWAKSNCDYGSSPGRYTQDSFPSWRLFDESCSLKDILSQYEIIDDNNDVGIVLEKANGNIPPVGILMLGDSVEQLLIVDTCASLLGVRDPVLSVKDKDRGANFCGHQPWGCEGCSSSAFAITRTPTHGVLRAWDVDGHPGVVHIDKVNQDIEAFTVDRGRPPDIITLAFGFWDVLVILCSNQNATYLIWGHLMPECKEPWPKWQSTPEEYLIDWLEKTETFLKRLKVIAPESLLIFRTYALPPMLDCNVTGDSIIRTSHLGNSAARTLIVQLNSAARHVARKYGIPVVDVEAMGLSFANPTSFFRDGHHPSPHVTKEILNIYINIWVQHHAHRHSAIHNPGHSGQLKDLT